MCAVQESTDTRHQNTDAMDIQHNAKQEWYDLVKREKKIGEDNRLIYSMSNLQTDVGL